MAEYIDREEMLERFDRRANLAAGDKRVGVASIRAFIENAPVADAVSRGVYEQVIRERDVAIEQLKSIGKSFGENTDDVVSMTHNQHTHRLKKEEMPALYPEKSATTEKRPNELFPIGIMYFMAFDPNQTDEVPGEWEMVSKIWKRIK